MSISIRRIDSREQAVWTNVGRRTYGDADFKYDDVLFAREFDRVEDVGECVYLIAEKNGCPVGRLRLRNSRDQKTGAAHSGVCEVSVVPELRRQGIGSALVEAALKYAKTHNDEISSELLEEDDDVLAFFNKAGFKERCRGCSVVVDMAGGFPARVLEKVKMSQENGFKVRDLNPGGDEADFEFMIRLVPKYATRRKRMRWEADNGMIVMVLEKEGKVIGHVTGVAGIREMIAGFVRDPAWGMLWYIIVSQEYRRMGLATRLVYELMLRLKGSGNTNFIYAGCSIGGKSMKLGASMGDESYLRKRIALVRKM